MHAVVCSSPPDLLQIEQDIWDELQRSVQQSGHGWHRMAMASQAEDGWPDARTVVLRECLPEERQLMIYTDARSAKVRQLERDPRVTLVGWSNQLCWQLRLRCRVEFSHAGLAVTSRWARIRLTPGAQDYLSPLPPGSELAAPMTDGVAEPRHANTIAHHHFGVLTATVESIDWLELGAHHHRRALFESGGRHRWLTP